MSCRQSARKVKLTSKFEEFSTTRLASIQRLAQSSEQKHQHREQQQRDQQQREQHQREQQQKEQQQHQQNHRPEPKTPKTVEEPVLKTTPAPKATPAQTVINHHEAPHNHGTVTPTPKLTANGKIRGRPRKCWQKAETVVKPMSSTREELLRLREELAQVKKELEERNNEYAELQRQSSYTGQTVPKGDYDDLKERYQRDIMHAKRNEWCVTCLNPSRYFCCWNTTYCSQKCQVTDWYARHGKSCERTRAMKTVS